MEGLFSRFRRVDRNINLTPERNELVYGRGSRCIHGDKEWSPPFFLKPFCQLCDGCRLSRSMKPDKHKNGRRVRSESDFTVSAPHKVAEFIMNDFYNLLSGGNAFNDFPAYSLGPDPFYKVLYDLKIHVSLEESDFYLPESGRNILFFEETPAFEFLEYAF